MVNVSHATLETGSFDKYESTYIDNFKQESELIKENTEGHYGNITYNNHISSENMLTLFNEANNHLDKPRIEKNIPSFGYYENDYFMWWFRY